MSLVDLHRLARRTTRRVAACAVLAGLAGFGVPAGAADGARVASDHGCLNCHYNEARSAPTLKQLAERAAHGGDSPEAVQHMLREMRENPATAGARWCRTIRRWPS